MANPNMLAALGQWFAGRTKPSYRTPPFQRPTSASRGAVPGSPAAPTPGQPVPSLPPGQAGAPGAPIQPPAQAGNPVWNALMNPTLGGAALAAGQQLTRARYPGESGMSNAVSAVTAGYNQVAMARAQQWAREQEVAKAKLAAEEQFRKNIDTNSVIADRTNQGERRQSQSTNEAQKYGLEERKLEVDQTNKENDQALKASGQLIDQQNADSLKASREATTQQAKDQLEHNKNRLAQDVKEHEDLMSRRDKEHIDQTRLAQLRADISAGQLAVAKEGLKVRLSNANKLDYLDYIDQAAEDIAQQDKQTLAMDPYGEKSKKFSGPMLETTQKIDRRAQELMKQAQAAGSSASRSGPVPSSAPAGSPQIVVNPKTGERLMLQGGKWVPVSQ